MSLLALKGLASATPALKAAAAKKVAAVAAKKAAAAAAKKALGKIATNVAVSQGTKALNTAIEQAASPNLTGTGIDMRQYSANNQPQVTEPELDEQGLVEEEAPLIEEEVPTLMRKKGGKLPISAKVSKKIKKLMSEGYSRKQAIAIALSMKEKNKLNTGGFMKFIKNEG